MTDAELLRRALAKAGKGTPPELAGRIGVSAEKVRQWLAQLDADDPIRLIARTRTDLEAYLSRGNGEESPDYWRGVLATHRNTLRAIVATMDEQLSGVALSDPPTDARPARQGKGSSGSGGEAASSATLRRVAEATSEAVYQVKPRGKRAQ